jgi:uncharacterized protein (TIGR03083 family)
MITNDSDVQALVGPQFSALADALADQPSTAADSPSLCEGWAVKNVVAHMTMAVRYDGAAFLHELAAAGNNFELVSETLARRDGNLPFARLVADLRSETMALWVAPGGGATGALSHVVIHGLDITSALGLSRTADDDATRIVLDAMTTGDLAARFGTGPSGRLLRANDLNWRFGDGEPVDASAADLVLALAGRPRPGLDLRPAEG